MSVDSEMLSIKDELSRFGQMSHFAPGYSTNGSKLVKF